MIISTEKRVIILRSNPVSPDPRVEKTARALSQSGWHTSICAWDRSAALPILEERYYAIIHRVPVRSNYANGIHNLFSLIRWQAYLLRFLLKHKSDYTHIHACDFDTILPAFVIKILYGKKVIYDVFDFYADVHIDLPHLLQAAIRKLDLWIMGKIDAVIIVDKARLEQIKGAHPKHIEVIYNSPEEIFSDPELGDTCDEHQGSSQLRIAFVGILAANRGIVEMLNVLEKHPDWTMELAGFGGKDVSPIVARVQALPNVQFHGRVPYDQAMQINERADVLFATYDPKVLNHKYSSANKLFEAMMLGKPIIVAHNTGMDRIVQEHEIGFVVSYGDIEELDQTCVEIASWDSYQKKQFAQHTRDIYDQYYSWKFMYIRLQQLYSSII